MMIPTSAATLVSGLGNYSASTLPVQIVPSRTMSESLPQNLLMITHQVTLSLKAKRISFNTINIAQAEEISATIGQTTREIKMASIINYNIMGNDGNDRISKRRTDRQ